MDRRLGPQAHGGREADRLRKAAPHSPGAECSPGSVRRCERNSLVTDFDRDRSAVRGVPDAVGGQALHGVGPVHHARRAPRVHVPVDGGGRRTDQGLVVRPTGQHELDLADGQATGRTGRGVERRGGPTDGRIVRRYDHGCRRRGIADRHRDPGAVRRVPGAVGGEALQGVGPVRHADRIPRVDVPVDGGGRRTDHGLVERSSGESELDLADGQARGRTGRGIERRGGPSDGRVVRRYDHGCRRRVVADRHRDPGAVRGVRCAIGSEALHGVGPVHHARRVPRVHVPVDGGGRRTDQGLVVRPTGQHELDLADGQATGRTGRGVEPRGGAAHCRVVGGTITAVVGAELPTVSVKAWVEALEWTSVALRVIG